MGARQALAREEWSWPGGLGTFALAPGCGAGSWCSDAAPEVGELGHGEVARGARAQPPQVSPERALDICGCTLGGRRPRGERSRRPPRPPRAGLSLTPAAGGARDWPRVGGQRADWLLGDQGPGRRGRSAPEPSNGKPPQKRPQIRGCARPAGAADRRR